MVDFVPLIVMANVYEGNGVIDLSKLGDDFDCDFKLRWDRSHQEFELRFESRNVGYIKATGPSPEHCVGALITRACMDQTDKAGRLTGAMLVMIRDMQLGIETAMDRWRTQATETSDKNEQSEDNNNNVATYADVFDNDNKSEEDK